MGVYVGDRASPQPTGLMFAPNLPEWPIAALGAMAAGGVVTGANPMYNAADLAHQMRDENRLWRADQRRTDGLNKNLLGPILFT